MGRAEKEERVRGLAERLNGAQAAVLTDYRGLTVQEAAELRAALDEVDTRFSIVKNSLTRLAVKEAGLEALAEYVDGPTAIAFILGDPVSGAKRLVEQSRRYPVLEVRGGFAEGRVLTAEEMKAFAALDTREDMLARLAGLGKLQLSRTAWMLQALQSRFALLMDALKEKLPAEEPEASAVPAAEDHPDPEAPGSGGEGAEEESTPASPPEGQPEGTEPEEPAERPAPDQATEKEGEE
jgi:large subunit ribosomal protein L10